MQELHLLKERNQTAINVTQSIRPFVVLNSL